MENLETVDNVFGLTDVEVAERVADGRVNGDQNVKTKPVLQILREHTLTFFNMLFLAFAIVIVVFNLGWQELGFMVLVIVNSATGLWQELKAKKTIDKLTLLSQPKALARRNGVETTIEVSEIVQDDIILLKTGNQVSSDSKIIAGFIEVNESLLTGEPDPIPKNPGDTILSGSFVVSGKATTKVTHVGKDNYATKIQTGAKYLKKPNSEIMFSLNTLIKTITFILIPLGIALLVIKIIARNTEMKTALLDTVTMMVSLIPSGLVALTTAVFAISVIRISSHNALAQDLYVTETLARVDVLCLDKTGTITEGVMIVESIMPINQTELKLRQLLKNIDAAINDKNPTSIAISEFVVDTPQTKTASSFIAFSSSRKWSGANIGKRGYAMGAAEFVLKEISPEIQEIIDQQSALGNRVLVVAKSSKHLVDQKLNDDMELVGLIFITDKIRKEAKATLNFFKNQGVDIKIISGDNPITVSNVARKAGVDHYEKYIDVSTVKNLDLPKIVDEYTVFGRVNPDQKQTLVKALKTKGHTVAMTGDGVNDVLALRESDCSIAMVAGSDAAKNISQIVLLDNNFASLPYIVAEGRRSVNNLERSASLYIVKTIYSLLVAFLFLFVNQDLPYSLINITFISSLTVGIPSFFLALEKNEERITGTFLDKIVFNALPGALCVFAVIFTMTMLRRFSPMVESAFTVSEFKTITVILMGLVFFMVLFKTSLPLNGMRIILFTTMLIAFVIAFFIPITQNIFKLTTLPLNAAALIVPIGLAIAPIFILLTVITEKASRKSGLDRALRKISAKYNSTKNKIQKKRKSHI